MLSLGSLDPDFRPFAEDLVEACRGAGLAPRVTSARRSTAEQTRLYRRFLAGNNPYPVAPPGKSAHELGLAFDFVVQPMDSLADVGALWESWGGTWGGRIGDDVHFESANAKEAVAAQADETPWYESPIVSAASWFLPMGLAFQSQDPGIPALAEKIKGYFQGC